MTCPIARINSATSADQFALTRHPRLQLAVQPHQLRASLASCLKPEPFRNPANLSVGWPARLLVACPVWAVWQLYVSSLDRNPATYLVQVAKLRESRLRQNHLNNGHIHDRSTEPTQDAIPRLKLDVC